jgi:hypothetical protein
LCAKVAFQYVSEVTIFILFLCHNFTKTSSHRNALLIKDSQGTTFAKFSPSHAPPLYNLTITSINLKANFILRLFLLLFQIAIILSYFNYLNQKKMKKENQMETKRNEN